MNRIELLPENEIANLIDRLERDLWELKQKQPNDSKALVFYESQSEEEYDWEGEFTTDVSPQAVQGPFLLVTAAATDTPLLLADLIVEKAEVDGGEPLTLHYNRALPSAFDQNVWTVFIGVPNNTTADVALKVRVVANTDVVITAEQIGIADETV